MTYLATGIKVRDSESEGDGGSDRGKSGGVDMGEFDVESSCLRNACDRVRWLHGWHVVQDLQR